jgi:hypothetical protein
VGIGLLFGNIASLAADDRREFEFVIQLVGIARPFDRFACANDRIRVALIIDGQLVPDIRNILTHTILDVFFECHAIAQRIRSWERTQ